MRTLRQRYLVSTGEERRVQKILYWLCHGVGFVECTWSHCSLLTRTLRICTQRFGWIVREKATVQCTISVICYVKELSCLQPRKRPRRVYYKCQSIWMETLPTRPCVRGCLRILASMACIKMSCSINPSLQ